MKTGQTLCISAMRVESLLKAMLSTMAYKKFKPILQGSSTEEPHLLLTTSKTATWFSLLAGMSPLVCLLFHVISLVENSQQQARVVCESGLLPLKRMAPVGVGTNEALSVSSEGSPLGLFPSCRSLMKNVSKTPSCNSIAGRLKNTHCHVLAFTRRKWALKANVGESLSLWTDNLSLVLCKFGVESWG